MPPGLNYATYDWTAKPKPHPLNEADAKEGAVVLRDLSVREYAEAPDGTGLHQYHLTHRIVHVNSTDAIEAFNKLAIPLPDGARLLVLKSRTVRPNGIVTEANRTNLKELKDEDGQRGFQVFAIEGVEPGCEIEYLYLVDQAPKPFGREQLQASLPTRDETVEIISPEWLTFEAKLYHAPAGTPAPRDSIIGGKHVIRVTLDHVPAAHAEPFSSLQAQLTRLEFKMAYTNKRGRERLFTWAQAAQLMHQQVYQLTKTEQKALSRFLKDLNVPASGDVAARVKAVELAVKTSFTANEAASSDLTTVLKTRVTSELGFTRLLGGLFKLMGIDSELVVTTDRSEAPFDGSFDTWSWLSHYLFFFPATDQYLAPGQLAFRYGMVPAEWTATQGLFVKIVRLGEVETGVGTVRDITPLPASKSAHNHTIKVRFADDMASGTVEIKEELSGYSCQPFQPFFSLIPEEKRTELLHTFVKGSVPDAAFEKLQASNTETDKNPLDHPFTITATVKSAALLARAGNRYLFKVGELIGPQSEMYRNDDRQFDIENEFNRHYDREITFDVPTGYRVRNLSDATIDAQSSPDPTPAYFFHAKGTQQGRTVTLRIREAYNQIYWPKKDLETFRSVVNAAANFNKVVLVLEKE